MAYKPKNCPTCNTTHTKRGPYCSRSCGNSRSFTPEEKANLSAKQKQHINSDADTAEETRWRYAEIGRIHREAKAARVDHSMREQTPDDYNIIPPRLPEGNTFVSDGDLWSED